MNTLTPEAPVQTPRPAAVQPGTTGIRIVGAVAALALAAHLAVMIAAESRWDELADLVMWSALAFPLAQVAIVAVMWHTRAASRVLLAVTGAAFAALAMTSALAASAGDPELYDDVESWIVIGGLVAAHLVALHVLARGAWRGVLRWVPLVPASWGIPATVMTFQFPDVSPWWGLIVTLVGGLALVGAVLAAAPRLALPATAR